MPLVPREAYVSKVTASVSQKDEMTCAQMAIVPRNRVSEASTAASSTTARPRKEHCSRSVLKSSVAGLYGKNPGFAGVLGAFPLWLLMSPIDKSYWGIASPLKSGAREP
jgi:hypothetical protein